MDGMADTEDTQHIQDIQDIQNTPLVIELGALCITEAANKVRMRADIGGNHQTHLALHNTQLTSFCFFDHLVKQLP